MARQFKRAHHPGQRRQVQLPSLGFPQGNEDEGFYLAKQITLGIDAFAFPSLKAVGNGTCTPCSAGDVVEMPHGVNCCLLVRWHCPASAAEQRRQEAGAWAVA